jgi:hypothetical protein
MIRSIFYEFYFQIRPGFKGQVRHGFTLINTVILCRRERGERRDLFFYHREHEERRDLFFNSRLHGKFCR